MSEIPLKVKVTSNSKTHKRMESKKRKIAAFLDLVTLKDSSYEKNQKQQKTFHVELSEEVKTLAKKPDDSIINEDHSLDKLREQLRNYQKTVVKKPAIYLTNLGLLGKINIEPGSKIEEPPALSFSPRDIQDTILLATIGYDAFVKTRFCTLFNFTELQTVSLIVLEGISCQDYLPKKHMCPNLGKIFQEGVQLSIVDDFYQELIWDSTNYKTDQSVKNESLVEEKICSRVDLLLSPVQMIMEGYPMPNENVYSGFSYTIDNYDPVDNNAPLYALDCEMVETSGDPHALARIAIVNENEEIIYDTYVIPPAKVTNYLTEYSGITEKLLNGVTKTLEDVRSDIKNLIPPNAILCGQSLNFDLICLKLFHPYVIDTSSIFNLSGNPGQKHKLKYLSSYFLKSEIQNSENGHDPGEDSLAVMKLVRLKLQNPRRFGDASLGWHSPTEESKEESQNSCHLLSKISKKKKKISVVGERKHLKRFKALCSTVWDEIQGFKCKDIKHIKDTVMSRMWEDDLVVSHASCPVEEIATVDNIIGDIYSAAPEKTLFLVVFVGKMNGSEETGLCLMNVK